MEKLAANKPDKDAEALETVLVEEETAKIKLKEEDTSRKEKSVLQAKLTKLAIQIGYAGSYIRMHSSFYFYYSLIEGSIKVIQGIGFDIGIVADVNKK